MHSGHLHNFFGSMLCRFNYLMKSHSIFSLSCFCQLQYISHLSGSVQVDSITYGRELKVHAWACVQQQERHLLCGHTYSRIKAHGLPPNLCPLRLLLISKSKKRKTTIDHPPARHGKSSDDRLHPIQRAGDATTPIFCWEKSLQLQGKLHFCRFNALLGLWSRGGDDGKFRNHQ